jgi:hypothetical protein
MADPITMALIGAGSSFLQGRSRKKQQEEMQRESMLGQLMQQLQAGLQGGFQSQLPQPNIGKTEIDG